MIDDSFSDPAVQRCPFPLVKAMHREGTVHKDPVTGFYVVSGYAEVSYVNQHPELFSNRTDVMNPENSPALQDTAVPDRYDRAGYRRVATLVNNDPPAHGPFRAAVEKIFSPTFVRALEPGIVAVVDTLIDDFVADDETDLLEFCIRVPMYVFVDQFGLPRHQWRLFKKWADTSIGLVNPMLSLEQRLELTDIHIEMQRYLIARGEEYRRCPANTLLSMLVHSTVEGRPWTPAEFVTVAEVLFVAGAETTTSAIAHSVDMLIQVPDLQSALRRNPSKIGAFVEEALRLHAPSPHLYRKVIRDVRLGGVDMPKDSIIMLSYLAANRDPRKYNAPEDIDLSRPGIRNHLTFGSGTHHCVGNVLARTEVRICLERLLARLNSITYAPSSSKPVFSTSFHVHKLENLRIAFRSDDGERRISSESPI